MPFIFQLESNHSEENNTNADEDVTITNEATSEQLSIMNKVIGDVIDGHLDVLEICRTLKKKKRPCLQHQHWKLRLGLTLVNMPIIHSILHIDDVLWMFVSLVLSSILIYKIVSSAFENVMRAEKQIIFSKIFVNH